MTELSSRMEANLRTNILPFWLHHARDQQRGGFFGQINVPLDVKPEAPRGALLSARILWTFSAAYRRYREPAYLDMARWAYEDLNHRFWDPEHGGLYWMVSADGQPTDARKLLYAQAFGIYGMSEFYRASGDSAVLDRTTELYRVVEEHCHDRNNGGYFEEFSRDWQVSRERGARKSAMGSAGQKSQNVHLHVMEAYANYLRIRPSDAAAKANLREIVDVLLNRVLDSKTHHLHLFLEEDWTPSSDTISFGHDIEFSWLLTETTELLADAMLIDRAKKEAVEIARVTLAEGVAADGGVLAEAGPSGVTDTFKEWWPQAEAVVGFFNAYQISGDAKYRDAALHTWQFIEDKLIDRENGEWLIGVSPPGSGTSPIKAGFWKCPYHNGRACMELVDRVAAAER